MNLFFEDGQGDDDIVVGIFEQLIEVVVFEVVFECDEICLLDGEVLFIVVFVLCGMSCQGDDIDGLLFGEWIVVELLLYQ